ncbi:hypothetical protein PMPD1_4392 (plasmid) [Paramixta manurensis]|uniref:Uncharacterized protein n=1 Tax=Paramixta manurensis TaxID=2740817 RepID=A0A6M8UN95_9GAMM|nr:hypothetical protein PMPD1_4392 [Erwiniaceae bacterium PD-1]
MNMTEKVSGKVNEILTLISCLFLSTGVVLGGIALGNAVYQWTEGPYNLALPSFLHLPARLMVALSVSCLSVWGVSEVIMRIRGRRLSHRDETPPCAFVATVTREPPGAGLSEPWPESDDRYLVLKISDIRNGMTREEQRALRALSEKVTGFRQEQGKPGLVCVVIEYDWPEYPVVTRMLTQRIKAGASL